jgi:hypothetical protein
MKHQFLFVACLLLFCLNTSCEKAGQIHLISANTWVVTEVSNISNFAQVGDELTFFDNRLFFKNSNGVETDGRWNFPISSTSSGPVRTYDVDELFVSSGFGSYDFSVITLNAKELEISDISPSFGSFTVKLEAKE